MDFRLWLLLCLSVSSTFVMNPETRFFNDETGRTRIFHGVNAVVKVPPFLPITDHFDPQMSISAEDIDDLVSWGFNFVRLGVMWESTETAPGVFNVTYLNEVNDLITTMGEAGIYTLVDAHQDVFAQAICGEGVPDFWAVNLDHSCDYGLIGLLAEFVGLCTPMSAYNFTYDSQGNPLVSQCLEHMFSDYYMTPEAMSAFDNLYSNNSGLLTHFFEHWINVATVLGENPYVIGYDLINEPLAANLYKNPILALPGRFDLTVLQPLYQKLSTVIREYSPDKIIFFEPIQTDLLPVFGGIVFHAGFDQTPGGPEYDDLQIFNDHTYCCQAGPSICATGEPPLSDAAMCLAFHQSRIQTRVEDAERLGVGLIISEFGACTDSEACVVELTSVTDTCDQNLLSWAYWMFKGFGDYTTSGSLTEGFYNQTGGLQTNKLRALSRTYIPAFQGVPKSVSFDSESGAFFASYFLDPGITAPTVLFYNAQIYYPNGYTINAATVNKVPATVTSINTNYLEIAFPNQNTTVLVLVLLTPIANQEMDLVLSHTRIHYSLSSVKGTDKTETSVIFNSSSLPTDAKLIVSGEFGGICSLDLRKNGRKCVGSSHIFYKNLFKVMVGTKEIDQFSIPQLNGETVQLEVELL